MALRRGASGHPMGGHMSVSIVLPQMRSFASNEDFVATVIRTWTYICLQINPGGLLRLTIGYVRSFLPQKEDL